jgi:hypothetical protein
MTRLRRGLSAAAARDAVASRSLEARCPPLYSLLTCSLPVLVALLLEMSTPLGPKELRAALEGMLSGGEAHAKLSAAVRMVVQLAQLDGPLRMLGGPPSFSDLATFQQHLLLLMGQINMMHDPSGLGGMMQSQLFLRSKYELFALQHVQLLVSTPSFSSLFVRAIASLARSSPRMRGHSPPLEPPLIEPWSKPLANLT